MKGDFTRLTWKPEKRYDSVRMQQGRVQLDADWNEQMDIQAHLRETALRDVIGGCCAPEEEPGFGIEASGGDLTISTGRLYVDGILCEQPVEGLTYLGQDDLPGAELPASPATHLVFLDVWKWHLTALEDPEIREVALGGPDTATRLRTVCQVKLLPLADDTSACGDPLTEWDDLIAPSTATLAARTQPVTDPDDPCIVPATAGYTRIEHQLYRIEIHDKGDLGDATFKWSRDNGSIVTDWLEQDGDRLRVRSTGRDRLLGFHDARWVELTDDDRELREEPGILVEVVSVEGDFIEIDPGGQVVDITTFGRHPKVRRWDMDGDDGAMTVEVPVTNDGWIPLEGGIEIHFDTGFYESGDYWLIPARAFVGEFAGDIEWPKDPATSDPLALPPHGIEHHYCRLALVDFDGEEFETVSGGDCRHTFPSLCGLETTGEGAGEGCCTQVVEVGEPIQPAIDAVVELGGGCVCLRTGEHVIEAPLNIPGSNITLHGESPGTRVIRRDGVMLLEIGDPTGLIVTDVAVQWIHFELESFSPDDPDTALVHLRLCERVSLSECGMAASSFTPVAGVQIDGDRDIRIERCAIERVSIGVWVSGDTTALTIRDNTLAGSSGETPEEGAVGIHLMDAFGPSRIEGNEITGYAIGISLNSSPASDPPSSGAAGSLIVGNRIDRQSDETTGASDKIFGIEVGAAGCLVRDNTLSYASPDYGGIHVTGPGACIDANRLESFAREAVEGNLPLGILLGFPNPEGLALSHDGVIRGNRLSGAQDAIWVAGARRAAVTDNLIEGDGAELRAGVALTDSGEARVEGNRISGSSLGIWAVGGDDHRFTNNHLRDGGFGITLDGTTVPITAATVADNRIEAMGGWGVFGANLLGTTKVVGNRIVSCGTARGVTVGLGLYVAFGDVEVQSCEIVDTGVAPDGTSMTQPAYGLWGVLLWSCRIANNLISYSAVPPGLDSAAEDRAALLWGLFDLQLTDTFVFGGSAQVLGNEFIGPGASHLVEFLEAPVGQGFLRFERVTFSDNYCWHWSNPPDERFATVSLRGRRALVIGNHVKANTPFLSFDFHGVPGVFMGNDTQGTLNAPNFPAPEANFNL